MNKGGWILYINRHAAVWTVPSISWVRPSFDVIRQHNSENLEGAHTDGRTDSSLPPIFMIYLQRLSYPSILAVVGLLIGLKYASALTPAMRVEA